MGYLFALCEAKQAGYQRITCALPSMSRPLYETLLTGRVPVESGIVHNACQQRSSGDSIFQLAREHGLISAAAAYHWVSELYQQTPYDPYQHRFQFDNDHGMHHGIFYHLDHYPDAAVLQDGEYLRTRFEPDFLLIHTMNVDDSGHRHGVNSAQYHLSARHVDGLLSLLIPEWTAQGYQIIITADHGMGDDRAHGGTHEDERNVPFFTIGTAMNHDAKLEQTQVCATLCAGLGITHPLGNAAAGFWRS